MKCRFFNDYIELYKKDGGIAKELRFSEPVERIVAAWHQSWSRTNTAANRRLVIDAATNLDALGSRLRNSFSNEEVYPNLSSNMVGAIQQLLLQGRTESAVKVGSLVLDLYPRLENPSNFHGVYGVALVVSGDRSNGMQYLKRAYDRNANGVASAARLNRVAHIFAETNMADRGLAILEAAVELHPQAAGLHYSLGEFYLQKGMKEKAIASYKKALEINPKFANAEDARATLKKLEN